MDEAVWERVKQATQAAGINLLDFVLESRNGVARRAQIADWEQQHREGYQRYPVTPGEFEMDAADLWWEDK